MDYTFNCTSPAYQVSVLADNNGAPGAVIATQSVPVGGAPMTWEGVAELWSGVFIKIVHIPIDPLDLTPGTYWLEVNATAPTADLFSQTTLWCPQTIVGNNNGFSTKQVPDGPVTTQKNRLNFAFAICGPGSMPLSACAPPPPAIEAECENTSVSLQSGGTASITASDVDGGSSGFTNISVSPSTFDCTNLGDNVVTLTVDDGNGNSDNCTATVTVALPDGLPSGWTVSDIGTQNSDYSFDPCASNSGDYNISTDGYNLLPNTSDNMAFGALPLCGNGGIQARIESIDGGYAGLMIRESSAPGAKMTAIYSNLTNLLRRETRYTTNGTRSSGLINTAFPTMLRLVRQGDWIRGFYKNSSQWVLFHQVYLPMDECVEMGLAVFSTDPFGTATATFDRVNFMSGANLSAPATGPIADALSDVQRARVAPNPTSGAFTLDFERPLEIAATAVLRNELGQALEQLQLPAGAVNHNFDGSNLPRGLYFLEVRDEQGYREVLKVVRQ